MVKLSLSFNRFPKQWAWVGLGFALSLCFSGGVYAQTNMEGDTLAPFEQTLFSHDYMGEPMAARLERLESSVFGDVQKGSEAERQARLVQAMSAARAFIPSAPKSLTGNQPAADASGGISRFNAPGSGNGADNAQDSGVNDAPDSGNRAGASGLPPTPPPGDSDYPAVTALEREVFSRDFLREDISHRLERLEKRVFGQSSPQMALVDRVDRLMARYPNASAEVARYARGAGAPSTGSNSSALSDLPSDSHQFVGGMDTYAKVSALETKLFNGKTYSGELLTQRLDRLEGKTYGYSFSGESVDTRVNRLLGGYRVASKNRSVSPDYNQVLTQPDPAKWQSPPAVGYTGSFLSSSQRSNSGYGGGGYSSSSSSSSGYGSPNSVPQNIQLGSGFSSSSSSTYQFSPEMQSMLPPGMRQQMGGGGSTVQQQSSDTVIGAPGTVVTQQSTSYPGFQTYGGPPVQNYNYYGNPNGQGQTQSTTTVIPPNGGQNNGQSLGQTVYNYPGTTTSTYPGNPNGLPNPAYVGDPALLQNLGNLELNVYGQVDMMNPVSMRLGRLEQAMLGQIYMGYPDAQRLANLQKAYQLQSVGRLLGKGKGANMGRAAGGMLFGVPLNTPNSGVVPAIPTH